ncbi:MAG: lysine exporter LysO family protein [Spirochaetales bacterium]|nr:lysine exporter LysO family protein [Spirochaetales bacterium]
MSQLLYLASLLAALLLGVAASRLLRPLPSQLLRRVTAAVLYVLIFTMGFRIGRTEEAVRSFGRIGLQGLLYAAATIGGTILVLSLMFRLSAPRGRRPAQAVTPPAPRTLGGLERKALADPLRLLGVLAAGILTGRFLPLLRELRPESVITWILYGLLFLIGITLARSGLRLRELLDHSLWILPVGTALGTLAGGGALALLLRQRLGSGLALSAGFGWYSLSGVLLIELDGPTLGATAFLANMFREALALILIPLLARGRYSYVAIGVAGATSMDVTLPLIEKSCGPRSVPFSVASGALLSTAVPILVPLLYPLG